MLSSVDRRQAQAFEQYKREQKAAERQKATETARQQAAQTGHTVFAPCKADAAQAQQETLQTVVAASVVKS